MWGATFVHKRDKLVCVAASRCIVWDMGSMQSAGNEESCEVGYAAGKHVGKDSNCSIILAYVLVLWIIINVDLCKA